MPASEFRSAIQGDKSAILHITLALVRCVDRVNSPQLLYYFDMSTHCSECARHWSAYYAATVEETLAQEKLAAAKLRKINAKLIAALSARVKTLSLIVALSSQQVSVHRATHQQPF
jgi:NMD protein affecting ribosome stability and mRNA decay